MEFEFLNINFDEIFVTILSVVILGLISICFFCWFKGSSSNINENSLIHQSSNNKKKTKKKLNSTKSSKQINSNGDVSIEKTLKNKHIEIKPCPEILEESSKEAKPNVIVSPSKPILRKYDDQPVVNEENYVENNWSKIPKDEIEIHRSRQSSVVSESRSPLKEVEEAASKLSRGQKKRLKAKLKIMDLKTGENKPEIQVNNSAVYDDSNEVIYDDILVEESNNLSMKSNLSKGVKRRFNKKLKNCPSNSTESSLGNEKLHSFSSAEFEDKNQCESSIEDFKVEEPENQELLKTENLNINPPVDEFSESEIQIKCDKFELENKELKHEMNILKHKLNDFSAMSSTVVNLKKEHELLIKKHCDLERTCSAIQKELTNSIQKTNSAETRVLRLNTERNQQISFYENEINKCNNNISILEGDIRSKTTENETLKMNLEQLRHLVSDKEQLIQSQNNELSLLKEQCYKKRIDYQEIEVTANNITMKYKEIENQNQKLIEENQKFQIQMELNEKESQKKFDKFKIQIKNKEKEQNSLISSLQYQLDEFQREKQLYTCNPEIEELKEENEKIRNLYQNLKKKCEESTTSYNTIPSGYELIEIEKLKQLTSKINDGNRILQEKCDHYNLLIRQQNDKDILLQKNMELEVNYSKLNLDLKGHLNEIVNLRSCIEELQLELSKNSESNLEELKVELDEKCETLRKTEVLLSKLESSVDEEELNWKVLLHEKTMANEKLENELKQKSMTILNLNKKINELTSVLQSTTTPQYQSESILNGSLSVE